MSKRAILFQKRHVKDSTLLYCGLHVGQPGTVAVWKGHQLPDVAAVKHLPDNSVMKASGRCWRVVHGGETRLRSARMPPT